MKVGKRGSDQRCHHAALFRFCVAIICARRILVGVCAVAATVVVHSEQVAELVGNNKGGGESVFADQHATS